MKTATVQRQQFGPKRRRFRSQMDIAVGWGVNQCPYGRRGGLAGQIKPDGTGKIAEMQNLRRAVEDQNIGEHRSGNTKMVVEQAVTLPLEEVEGMEEVAEMGRGRLKVSERMLASKCYVGSFM